LACATAEEAVEEEDVADAEEEEGEQDDDGTCDISKEAALQVCW